MTDVNRICCECDVNQTPLGKGLNVVKNSRGNGIGLFCDLCVPIAKRLVDDVASAHGAYIVDGFYRSSPRGTPDHRSTSQIRSYLESLKGERAVPA
ncbi:hypothetical protein [Nevskia ramosa]|uniref:hypothetical protein n=1 Tax=Nevskia ramosa TaxID=64002 RepID=UPI002352B7AD|nr:hypothetical protein [Nevskia ramosa]